MQRLRRVFVQHVIERGLHGPPIATARILEAEQGRRNLAQGARATAGADIAISVTGIAGPGGSNFTPEGRVCFGLATPKGVTTQTVEFGALGRAKVRAAARDHALGLLAAALDPAEL